MLINDYCNKLQFNDISKENRERIAVKDSEESLTYSDINRYVEQLISSFLERGIGKQDIVAIYLPNSCRFYVATIAIMRLGAIFVPIATNNPESRSKSIISNCKPKAVITNKKLYPSLSMLLDEDVEVFFVDEDNSTVNATSSDKLSVREDNIAYIIYTSGSTGEPKGVAIKISSLLNFINDTIDRLDFSEDLVTLNMTSFAFDGALTGLFCAFFCRGKLVIRSAPFLRPNKYLDYLCSEGITDIGCSPIQLGMLADALEILNDPTTIKLKTIAVGGEELPKKYILQIMESLPGVRVLNRYGPTETTIVASSFDITIESLISDEPLPIGKPIHNVFFKLVDEEITSGKIVGELYIGGIQVMHSYWNDYELTDNSIFIDERGIPWYKTRDLAYIDSNDNYVFTGRKDDMVKIRGIRIHLSEIDRSLERISSVNKSYSILQTSNENKRIISFVMTNSTVTEGDIKKELSNYLPINMLPARIISCNTFPQTNNGKVDKKALMKLLEAEDP